MKPCLVLAVLFVAFAFVATSEAEETFESSRLPRRDTIHIDPPSPRCVFYECRASCIQRGYKSGGYCTINGCQCLR